MLFFPKSTKAFYAQTLPRACIESTKPAKSHTQDYQALLKAVAPKVQDMRGGADRSHPEHRLR